MEIENTCFPGELAYSRPQMRFLLFKAKSVTLVEESGRQITGYVTALFRKNSDIAGIETIGVAPSSRGKGTGKRLLRAVEDSMVHRGTRLARLEVSAGNSEAIAMYRKAGYEVTETIPDYYIYNHNGTKNAFRMVKAINRQ